MASTGMIQHTSLSFEAILEDLVKYAKNKPDGLAWQDWFKSSDGQIVAEWIAGLGTFRAYHEFMRIREGQLDNAQLDSSVFNLAFNKGLLIPPSLSGEISINITTPSVMSFSVGDLIGTVGAYEVYSLEGKTIDGTDDLHCVVGHLQEFALDVPGLAPFQAFHFTTTDTFFASQLEKFYVDGEQITLLSDPDYLNGTQNDFILRRCMPSQSRIYTGNGVLGWTKPNASSIQYKALTYSSDIVSVMGAGPKLIQNNIIVNDTTILTQPSLSPNKEEVRALARYYPIDGRCVTDTDYKAIISKFYGGIIADIYSFNTDPDQHIHILKDDNFGVDSSPQEAAYLEAITKLVDSKRAMGMHVYYTLRAKSSGSTFHTALKIPRAYYSNDLIVAANSYLATKIYTFMTQSVTLTTEDLAVELSAKFSVPFFPDASDTITLTSTDFLKSFYITATSFDPPAVIV